MSRELMKITERMAPIVQLPVFQALSRDPQCVRQAMEVSIEKTAMLCSTEFSQAEVQMIADEILDTYTHDRLDDILDALKRGRRGEFGKVFGKINLPTIMTWIQQVQEIRAQAREAEHAGRSNGPEYEYPNVDYEAFKAAQNEREKKAKHEAARHKAEVRHQAEQILKQGPPKTKNDGNE